MRCIDRANDQGDELELLSPRDAVVSGKFILHDITKGLEIPMDLFASEDQRRTLLAGGRLNEVKA